MNELVDSIDEIKQDITDMQYLGIMTLLLEISKSKAGDEEPEPEPEPETATEGLEVVRLRQRVRLIVADLMVLSWRRGGRYHSDNGPAVVGFYVAGGKAREEWYKHGEYHNENGPAVVDFYVAGGKWREEWYKHGEKHNENGPAVVGYDEFNCGRVDYEEWYRHGKLHRDNGPASISYYGDDGSTREERWYQDGARFRPCAEEENQAARDAGCIGIAYMEAYCSGVEYDADFHPDGCGPGTGHMIAEGDDLDFAFYLFPMTDEIRKLPRQHEESGFHTHYDCDNRKVYFSGGEFPDDVYAVRMFGGEPEGWPWVN